jgi:hypothetical protein
VAAKRSIELVAMKDPRKAIKDYSPLPEDNSSCSSSDPMLAIYQDFASQSNEWKTKRKKKLLRRVDWRLVPLLVTMYLLNFLDRNNLAQTRLGTLETDLGMKKNDFNLATNILFVVRKACLPT